MSFEASLFFHGQLNDFLLRREKGQWKKMVLNHASSLKDAVEAAGVPHVEVAKLLVGGTQQAFTYLLQPNDCIEVFPYENHFPAEAPASFVLDVHLGKLARLLRMLGIDAAYQNHCHDSEIVAISVNEGRTVLTRDIGLLKHKVLRFGYWLRSQQPDEQLREVIRMFSLCGSMQPFSRCMACNGTLAPVRKEEVLQRLPEQTQAYFDAFYQCTHCKNVYWKGSHFENMQRLIERIRSFAC